MPRENPLLTATGATKGTTVDPACLLVVEDDAALSDEEKVMLLDAGADDFIQKPCSPAELLARVRGQLRRAAMSTAARSWSRFTIDGVEIDLVTQRVTRNGEIQRLTPTEWALLRALILHAGKPLSTKQLWDMVWAREFGDPTVHIRVHITHLRRKVEPSPSMPRLIVTEPGLARAGFDVPESRCRVR